MHRLVAALIAGPLVRSLHPSLVPISVSAAAHRPLVHFPDPSHCPATTMERPVATVALPSVLHQTLDVSASTRILIVGDLHGCFDELQDLLLKAEYSPDHDRLILVGDLVNKGPKSCEVVRFARESGALVVRGNQDDTALRELYAWRARGDADPPARNAFLKCLSAEDVAFLEQLPFSIFIPVHGVVVVHAGLVPGIPLAAQQPRDMYTMRFVGHNETAEAEAPWVALAKAPPPEDTSMVDVQPWAKAWKGPEHVIFGHDAKAGVQQEAFATGLDSGCCYGKRLTACILPTRELVSVPARMQYAVPTIVPKAK